jgi:hypothetical protein
MAAAWLGLAVVALSAAALLVPRCLHAGLTTRAAGTPAASPPLSPHGAEAAGPAMQPPGPMTGPFAYDDGVHTGPRPGEEP